ncbi:hypothetical protein BDV12DRAFT_118389 [Aspergillus spectabilis]
MADVQDQSLVDSHETNQEQPIPDNAEALLAALPDEHLWRLLRRFNRQVSHVQAIPRDDEQLLDLNRADEELFPPEKLQRTIERFHTSVIAVFGDFLGHVTRLRSWNEPRRTGAFGAVYLIAWLCDLIIPVITILLVAMIFHPPFYRLLFPPVPKTLDTKSESKAVHRPVDAPQAHDGEEAELEAASFVGNFTTPTIEGSISGDMSLALSSGAIESPTGDETGKPPKSNPAIRRTMRILSNISDVFERISNLLSPSPPFNLVGPRLQLIVILSSISILSFLTSSYVIIKTCAFTIGLGFFGDPVFKRAIDYLDRNAPNWRECLDMEKTLLKAVPTHAQLTLTLLRIGEANSTPIPPPPSPGISETKSSFQIWRRKNKVKQTDSLIASPTQEDQIANGDGIPQVAKKPKKWLRILKFARRTITTAMKGHIAFDRAMTITASGYAKGLLSILNTGNWTLTAPPRSSFTFEAKFEGKRGTVVLDSSGESAVLYFTAKQAAKIDDLRVDSQKKSSIGFQIPVAEITELKKTEGLGWKGKLIVELAGGGSGENLADGLVVHGAEPGQVYHLTGMRARDQLFNRLVAGGGQFWEMK